jgi:hypothetical protein
VAALRQSAEVLPQVHAEMMLEVSRRRRRRRRRLTFAALEHPSRFLLLLLLAAAAYTRTELNLTVINLDFITAGVVTTSIHVLCSTCIAL